MNELDSIKARKAAQTRKRRAPKRERQAALDAALKRYCADRKAALANGGELPVMANYMPSVNWG